MTGSCKGTIFLRKPRRDFRLPTSHFRLPTSDFRLPTSDFLLPTSDFRLPTSNFRLPTSNFQLPTSNFQLPDFRLPTSDFRLPTSKFKASIFGVQLISPEMELNLIQSESYKLLFSTYRSLIKDEFWIDCLSQCLSLQLFVLYSLLYSKWDVGLRISPYLY